MPDPSQPVTSDAAVSNSPQPDATAGTPTANADPTNPVAPTSTQPQGIAGPGGPPQLPAPSAPNVQPQSNGQQQQPNLSKAPQGQQTLVSNSPTPQQQQQVQKASHIHDVLQALSGGPQYRTTIDANTGQATRTAVPLTKTQIGLALGLEALTGALSGLAQTGPAAEGKAGVAGIQQGEQIAQQRQEAQQQQEQQAQQDAQSQYQATARKATIFETNMRGILSAQQAENLGSDAIDKIAEQNRALGLLDPDAAYVENGGVPMTQQDISAAIASHKLDPTDNVGPIAGRVEVTNPDGTHRWEATHLVLKSGDTKVPLTQSDWDRFAAGGVRGYSAGNKIPDGTMIPLRMKANAAEQLTAHTLADSQLDALRSSLDGTPLADKLPAKIDWSVPGVDPAMQHYQRYTAANATNAADPYAALQEMGAAKRDPKTGEMAPNPDARYVNTIAQTLGGWPLLEAAHNEIAASKKTSADFAVIDSDARANAVLAAPKRFSQDQLSAAQRFRSLSDSQGASKAAQEARARAQAEGTDVKAMYQYGRNPVTGEMLNLGNAPDAALVDANGNVVPQDLASAYKPTAQQRQTADSARIVQGLVSDVQTAITKNPNIIGPLAGRSKQGLAAAGLGDKDAQSLLDNLSLMQSALMKMHSGSRGSEILLKKAETLVSASQNPDQMQGALSSIQTIANRYAGEDSLTTVADYKQQQQGQPTQQQPQSAQRTGTQAQPQPHPLSRYQYLSPTGQHGWDPQQKQWVPVPRTVQIPAGAQIGRDANGNIVGYKVNGQYTSFGGSQ